MKYKDKKDTGYCSNRRKYEHKTKCIYTKYDKKTIQSCVSIQNASVQFTSTYN